MNPLNPQRHSAWIPIVIVSLAALVIALFYALVFSQPATQKVFENTGAQTQQVYKWRMATTWPKNFPGLGMAAENFASWINEASNGRMQVTVYGANELVPALGVFDAVSSGSVELGHGGAYYWKGKIPAAPFFTSVPFGMNAQEMNGWLHYGNGLTLWREAYAPFNIVPFAGGNTGVQMAGWFNKEINSMADIKGLKMRIPGLGGEVFTRAGGVAVNIPGNELYTSLQTGVIDATEWVGPYNDLAFGFHQVAKYYYYPGWHEPGPTLELIVNKTALESLPADLQKLVEVTARAVNQDMLDEYTARNNRAMNELVTKHGVQIKRLPSDVLQKLKQISDEMYAEQSKQDPFFAKVYADYKAFRDQAKHYHGISEEAYYQSR
ncbi:TRAP transporter substrate-binding protein [Simiduia aestuariiviva]|uniref:TRAP-type mannitol/chloroaromatic compound transport system substrate-binding protein n=1 Tax=Simiduia aestuariiviva TaxID=1510459 RepID=A0A839UNS8_9GAMM|nr:TRAP transporter substrate-binding protein [Simiduia aestuariiviva]MBB3169844.1 TRAP-type mannitol/chloroaromatic compound transport system substrate-binding protein [Simiduia aestuariiviva]